MSLTNRLLEVNDLKVSFRTHAGDVQAVRGVSFDLYKGEILAIVGESGCGKSVTAQTIMRLIPDGVGRIAGGSIRFEEKTDIARLPLKQMERIRGAEMGMIFQDPMTSLNPTMRIGEQIAECLVKHRRLRKSEARPIVRELLEQVGISHPERRMLQYPHQLSGGMRQRAMIAMALSCSPKLLIADEPTTALDVTVQAQIIELLKRLARDTGSAVMMITHDLGVVAEIAQRVLVMYAGKGVELGTADDIFYAPRHPYTRALLKAMPRLDMPAGEPLAAIPGAPPDLLAPPAGCAFAARCPHAMRICLEEDPQPSRVSDTHSAACWLEHPDAPGSSVRGRHV